MISNNPQNLSAIEIDRIIEMAWEDRTTFESIQFQFGLKEQEVRVFRCGVSVCKEEKPSMRN